MALPDCLPNPLTCVKDGVGAAAGAVGDSFLDKLADAVGEGVAEMIKTLSTVWIKVGTPAIGEGPSSNTPSGPVAFIEGRLLWLTAFCAVISVIVGGTRMAWEGRQEPARELVKSLMTLTVVSGCGVAAISLAVVGSDQLANSIVGATDTEGFGDNLGKLLAFDAAVGGAGAFGTILIIILGLLAILASIVQVLLMVARSGALVLLAGTFPLAASFTNTGIGRAWFQRYCAWTLAFIAYKPAAAIIYATAFNLMGADVFAGDGALSVIVGLGLMILAVLALPALIYFLVPATAAVAAGSGGGGGAAMGVAALATAMPTGAVAVGAARGGGGALAGASGGSGATGAAGPSGGAGPAGGAGGMGPAGGAGRAGGAGARGPSGAGGASRAAGAAGAAGAVVTAAAQGAQAARGVADQATGSQAQAGQGGADGDR